MPCLVKYALFRLVIGNTSQLSQSDWGLKDHRFQLTGILSGDNQLLRTVIDASGLPLNEYSTSLNSSKRQLKIPYAIPDARDYEVAVLRRRSIRSYRDQGIPPTTMKQICAQGIDIVRQRINAGGPEHMIGIWVAISKPGDGLTQGFLYVSTGRLRVGSASRGLYTGGVAAMLHTRKFRCVSRGYFYYR